MTKKCGLATAQLYSLVSSISDSGMNPAAFSCLVLTYDMCQPIPAPGNVVLETAVANSSRCAASLGSPWPARAFSRDNMFWD